MIALGTIRDVAKKIKQTAIERNRRKIPKQLDWGLEPAHPHPSLLAMP